jgi:hypothetical protein
MRKAMKRNIRRLNIKSGLLIAILFIPVNIFSQFQKGQVLSRETNTGIGYVNVGIIGKNIGTVSDEFGNFTLALDTIYDNDSLRFSMIGYQSKSFLIGPFKENALKTVYLNPKFYNLQEVSVTYHKPKVIRLGNPVTSNQLRSGFANNNLGSEMGVKVFARRQVKLKDISINVAICTFDSVTYRLNIYQAENNTEYKNILTEPIYISFSKDKIKKALTFDLSKYSIVIEGNILVSIELYRDLGEGRLLFQTEYFTGITYHRKTSEGTWTEAPGVIGMYLHGQLLK